MRWLATTIVLLGASAAVVAGIYLRDRDPSGWLPPPRVAASQDAETILLEIACPRAICSYRLVGNPRPDHWLASIVDRSSRPSASTSTSTFDVDAARRGFTGTVSCDSVGAGADSRGVDRLARYPCSGSTSAGFSIW